jgi:hypothetical protein
MTKRDLNSIDQHPNVLPQYHGPSLKRAWRDARLRNPALKQLEYFGYILRRDEYARVFRVDDPAQVTRDLSVIERWQRSGVEIKLTKSIWQVRGEYFEGTNDVPL